MASDPRTSAPHQQRTLDFTGPPTAADIDLHRAFTAHYTRLWSTPEGRTATLAPDEAATLAASVRHAHDDAMRSLSGLGLECDVDAILFVGHARSNGHAVRLGARTYAWYALESYPSQAAIDVFVPHELAHAVHYAAVPAFEARSRDDQSSTGRQVVTEGIATWLARHVGGFDSATALWADYLAPAALGAWMTQARARLPEMARLALASWDDAMPGNPLFTAALEHGPERNRGGYLVGLEATERILARGWETSRGLVELDRRRAERLYRRALSELTG